MKCKNTWTVLSDALEEKISINNFSVSDSKITFSQNSEKIDILFTELSGDTLR